jgi:hypothetical protein
MPKGKYPRKLDGRSEEQTQFFVSLAAEYLEERHSAI